jgi:hypothetical protein
MTNIAIIVGSTRPGRNGEAVADYDRHGAASPPVLDIGAALDLLIVGLDALRRGCGIPPNGRRGEVPARLTLGALAVLDAAQRAEEHGLGRDDVLAYAHTVASRYLDLLPYSAFAAALGSAAGD